MVTVFDPKGDVDLLRRIDADVEGARRLGEFFMFHLGHPDISVCFYRLGIDKEIAWSAAWSARKRWDVKR